MIKGKFAGLLFVALALTASATRGAGPALGDGAAVHPPLRGPVLAKSNVVFSSRFKRPDAAANVKAFGANHVEWVYTDDQEFAADLKRAAPWFGGTINANGPLRDEAGYARDFDGNIIVAPWMKGWNGRWVSTTHPETQRVIKEQIKRYVELGVDSIQADDPMLQVYPALFQAGDFNPSTVEGFPEWLRKYPDQKRVQAAGLSGMQGDYRELLRKTQRVTDAADYIKRFRSFASTPLWLEYIQSTVKDHFLRVRQQLQAGRGKPIPLSMNLGVLNEPSADNRTYFLADMADYVIAEILNKDFAAMTSQVATLRSLGLNLVASIKPGEVAETRVALATLYATGAQAMVPWDVYMGNDANGQVQRYFGKLEDYGQLYRFVRAHPEVLDGLETAAVVGVLAPVEKYRSDATRTLVKALVERQIPFAFIPLSGKGFPMRPTGEKLSHLRLLLSVNDDADFSAQDRKEMESSGVPRLDARSMKAEQLTELQPFVVAPGAETLRVIPRAAPGDTGRLLIHMIDTSRAANAEVDMSCRRRIGIKRDFLGGRRITGEKWFSDAPGSHLAAADISGKDIYFTVQGCPLWGVLEIRMQK